MSNTNYLHLKLKEFEAVLADLRNTLGAPSTNRPSISFISPCFNEVDNLQALYDRIVTTCRLRGLENYEIIWVENGSSDGSFDDMQALCARDPRLKVASLSRNFGYQGAIACGLSIAQGEYVAILDGDLQDPPELVPDMMELAKSRQLQVVYGVRKKRQEGWLKRASYSAFYRLWKLTAEIDVPLDAGDYGVIHRSVVDVLNAMPERQRFNRGLRAWVGFSQAGYEYERDGRSAGTTKFNVRAMIRLALDGLIAYSVAPLRICALLGLMIFTLAFTLGVAQAIVRLMSMVFAESFGGVLPPGLTQTNLLIIAFAGAQIFFMGLLGEYVGRIYNEVKERPIYIIKRTLNLEVGHGPAN